MSRSTVALFALLTLFLVGAIVVAVRLQVRLKSPAGLRVSSEARLRQFAAALAQYHHELGAWPETKLQLVRAQQLKPALVAGIAYRRPVAASAPDSLLLWREEPLPGVQAGEPWAGDDEPAATEIPAVSHAWTVDGRFLVLPPDELRKRTAVPVESPKPPDVP